MIYELTTRLQPLNLPSNLNREHKQESEHLNMAMRNRQGPQSPLVSGTASSQVQTHAHARGAITHAKGRSTSDSESSASESTSASASVSEESMEQRSDSCIATESHLHMRKSMDGVNDAERSKQLEEACHPGLGMADKHKNNHNDEIDREGKDIRSKASPSNVRTTLHARASPPRRPRSGSWKCGWDTEVKMARSGMGPFQSPRSIRSLHRQLPPASPKHWRASSPRSVGSALSSPRRPSRSNAPSPASLRAQTIISGKGVGYDDLDFDVEHGQGLKTGLGLTDEHGLSLGLHVDGVHDEQDSVGQLGNALQQCGLNDLGRFSSYQNHRHFSSPRSPPNTSLSPVQTWTPYSPRCDPAVTLIQNHTTVLPSLGSAPTLPGMPVLPGHVNLRGVTNSVRQETEQISRNQAEQVSGVHCNLSESAAPVPQTEHADDLAPPACPDSTTLLDMFADRPGCKRKRTVEYVEGLPLGFLIASENVGGRGGAEVGSRIISGGARVSRTPRSRVEAVMNQAETVGSATIPKCFGSSFENFEGFSMSYGMGRGADSVSEFGLKIPAASAVSQRMAYRELEDDEDDSDDEDDVVLIL